MGAIGAAVAVFVVVMLATGHSLIGVVGFLVTAAVVIGLVHAATGGTGGV